MPTKEQLTKDLGDLESINIKLRQENVQNALSDGEAKAYDKVIQALKALENSESRTRSSYETSGGGVSRVLNAAAARFGVTMDYRTLTEAIGKLTEANQTQTELEELKNRWSAVEQVMYPRTVEYNPMRGS